MERSHTFGCDTFVVSFASLTVIRKGYAFIARLMRRGNAEGYLIHVITLPSDGSKGNFVLSAGGVDFTLLLSQSSMDWFVSFGFFCVSEGLLILSVLSPK
ncbi:protein of unknown function [Vibrio tapetis subsp. tapetis]|uniref:Uncharacterized protein n=1 Tax=Vibrio tapetis subsp. tapetis TaxID=1671868 RepID=A0A2N8ZJG7_9VIBR|nr:protein of unknown function [Vibrio tapetis subsp. tapetis]